MKFEEKNLEIRGRLKPGLDAVASLAEDLTVGDGLGKRF